MMCTDCRRAAGEQHRPSCHRQGLVTSASDYLAQMATLSAENMASELLAAGWREKTPTIWADPNGVLMVGPAGAWRTMKQRERKTSGNTVNSERR